ncbi:MAG: hypothetical protein P8Y70_15030 [Candidatus Lokiarchaeota archaeon]
MKSNEILKVLSGFLCLLIVILKVVQFQTDFTATLIYYNIFLNLETIDSIIAGLLAVIFYSLFAIIGFIGGCIIYISLGIILIVGRKARFIAIVANIISGISIAMSIRVLILYSLLFEFSMLTPILLILYILLFILCIISYIKRNRED